MEPHRPARRWPSVAIVLAVLLVGLGAVLTTAPPAAAITYVSGWITADTTWGAVDNVYVVTKHVTVRPGATLTVLPGTTVRFDSGMALYIEGSLVADGVSGNRVSFLPNSSVLNLPWYGVAFNASATGSVTWSVFDNCERAVMATDSSPVVNNNTVQRAGVGFVLFRSSSVLADNDVQRATFAGAYLNASDAQVLGNRFNGSAVGITAEAGGWPVLALNTITNITGAVAIGISVGAGTVAAIGWNTIQDVAGSRGANALAPGAAGVGGGAAFGVLVDSAPSASIQGNTFDTLVGGRGGDGADNPGGFGGRGGAGGPAAAIVVGNTPVVDIEDNVIRTVVGGRGGNGGTSPTTAVGGSGGGAGDAVAIGAGNAASAARWYRNLVDVVAGGYGGNGAVGATADGSGAPGGNSIGLLFSAAMDADASGNVLQNLRAGLGGNSSATGLGRGAGADGGAATGITGYSLRGWTTLHSNGVLSARGGNGGRGQARGGAGGNVTGAFVAADKDGNYNFTTATGNWFQGLSGGNGAIGQRMGGNGGTASGLGFMLSDFFSGGNVVWTLAGGAGGDALDGTDGGRGGDADGIGAFGVPSGWSAWDVLNTVTRGAPGAGPPIQASYGVGYYFQGTTSVATRVTVENGTIQATGSLDLWVDNYTDATTINTPFSGAKLAVSQAGNLTVKNYLAVDALWPDSVSLVAGASVLVTDEGIPVWNLVSATGSEPWLLVTDRVYVNSIAPRDNRTGVTVSYLAYAFGPSPRQVDMATSHTETFIMVDSDAPASAVDLLPAYTNTWSFTVGYTASDGNGTGLDTVTLWYRLDGGGWVPYATQPASASGSFAFTAAADGVYEFATTADDVAGNNESGPAANDTWTTVDTVRPGSRVDPLPTWRQSRTFTVTWSPDPGVTDIAEYEVQYDRGAGWTAWLTGTTQTSGSFTAAADGLYQFRSKATDRAGNVEVLAGGNDTWTIVDTFAPFSRTLALPVYETSTSFLVQWGPEADDVATYRIQYRDNGGPWTDWIASTNLTSGTFTGAADGHTYEYRSIATDYAGNVQTPPANNQSWTIVDVSPPDSAVSPLPPYETSLLITVNWGPVSGTTDIATYTLEVSDNGGPWTQVPGAVGTTATTTSFFGVDGHRFAFRTLARDRAGNLEPAPSGNDTWTIVDVTPPSVVTASPRGAGTNVTPLVAVTFSEPMDRASAEAAFGILPDMNGQFVWSADSRVMTFTPERPLEPGTGYVVTIDSSARDVAGNTGASYSFQFTTSASTSIGLGGDWLWIILAIVAGVAVAGTLLFLLLRRRGVAAGEKTAAAAAKSEEPAVIDDVFLLYNDGILIKHETRRLKPDIDTDILSGMLTAVQQFVKDSFRSEEGELDEMTFGQMHILIGRGKWVILAAMVSGDGTVAFTEQIKACIADIEEHQWDRLEGWNGDMVIAKTLTPYVKKLIRGEYA